MTGMQPLVRFAGPKPVSASPHPAQATRPPPGQRAAPGGSGAAWRPALPAPTSVDAAPMHCFDLGNGAALLDSFPEISP